MNTGRGIYEAGPVFTVAFFYGDKGVGEYFTSKGLYLDAKKAMCQMIADKFPHLSVIVYCGVHKVGHRRVRAKLIVWR